MILVNITTPPGQQLYALLKRLPRWTYRYLQVHSARIGSNTSDFVTLIWRST